MHGACLPPSLHDPVEDGDMHDCGPLGNIYKRDVCEILLNNGVCVCVCVCECVCDVCV